MKIRFVLCFTLFLSLLSAQTEVPHKEIVVLLHGLGRGPASLRTLETRLISAGYSVSVIGYKPFGQTPEQILDTVSRQIGALNMDSTHTMHFVGHSFGGLLIRAYLNDHRIRNLGRVVLMGTPNKGTPIVDFLRESWVLRLAGPAASALGTGMDRIPWRFLPPYYETGVIAGSIHPFDNEGIIPGDDDGIVPVESAKVEGMKDSLVLSLSHFSMLGNEIVAGQIVHFLQRGFFQHDQ